MDVAERVTRLELAFSDLRQGLIDVGITNQRRFPDVPPDIIELPPPPPPIVYPALTGLGVGDDFSTYPDTAALKLQVQNGFAPAPGKKYYLGAVNQAVWLNQLYLNPLVQYDGHACMEYSFIAAADCAQPNLDADLTTNGMAADPTQLWVQLVTATSVGWNCRGNGGGDPSWKFLLMGYTDGIGRFSHEYGNGSLTSAKIIHGFERAGIVPNPSFDDGYVSGHATDWAGPTSWRHWIIHIDWTGPLAWRTRFWNAAAGSTPVLRATRTANVPVARPTIGKLVLGRNFNLKNRTGFPVQSWYWGLWEAVDGDLHPNPFNLADA